MNGSTLVAGLGIEPNVGSVIALQNRFNSVLFTLGNYALHAAYSFLQKQLT